MKTPYQIAMDPRSRGAWTGQAAEWVAFDLMRHCFQAENAAAALDGVGIPKFDMADEINISVSRTPGAHWHAGDLVRWLTEGRATLYVGERLHCSVIWWDVGFYEVGHMFGEFNRSDALWALGAAQVEARRRGRDHERLKIDGRPGWPRMLRKWGILNDGRTWFAKQQ